MGRLAGKRAIISGAATGIGAATAHRFVAEGASLIILDVNDADGQQLNDDLRAPFKTGHGRALKQMSAQPSVRNAW